MCADMEARKLVVIVEIPYMFTTTIEIPNYLSICQSNASKASEGSKTN